MSQSRTAGGAKTRHPHDCGSTTLTLRLALSVLSNVEWTTLSLSKGGVDKFSL
jgi:hypothetical protein